GYGVYGECQPGSGVGGVGVYGTSSGLSGEGVVGQAGNNGVRGIGDTGVRGEGNTWGVLGTSANATLSGTGIRGLATATTGSASGVYGESAGPTGVGVQGRALHTSGAAIGVFGASVSPSGVAVQGNNTATTGTPAGVYGLVAAPSGVAVKGLNNATTGSAYGMFAQTTSDGGTALWAKTAATSGNTWGVFAQNDTGGGGILGIPRAVYGWATNAGAVADAVVGQTSHPGGIAVWALGNMTSSGIKSFVQPDPSDPSREIRFACLEGNESGTYFRGTATVKQGRATVDVPEEFRLASEEQGLTVQLTSVGQFAQTFVESRDLDRVVIRSDRDGKVDYFVQGVRRGFAKHEAFAANRSFVPTWRGVPFGTQYPDSYRRLLVENGILNVDFTPNEQTAEKLGWELRDPKTDPRSPLFEAPKAAEEVR
ncbi:MAG TPA: hypothetical protein VKE69_00540, partial [Planctomycetota bacterium]|nr:hypothetical protein [Planctomycetota bacterium]